MSLQRNPLYDPKDLGLLKTKTIFSSFGSDKHVDYVELHVYSGENVLESDYNVKSYSILQEDTNQLAPSIKLNIHGDIRSMGYQTGTFGIKYNFFRTVVGDPNNTLYIDEISNDRKEIRVRPVEGANAEDLEQDFVDFGERIEGSEISAHTHWPDVILNFGDDELSLAVNWAIDYETYPKFPYSMVFKLYEALPDDLEEGDKLWVVQSLAESVVEDIKLTTAERGFASRILAPPDFTVPAHYDPPTPTGWKSDNDLLAAGDTTNKNRLFQKLYSGSFGDIRPNIDFNIPQNDGDDTYTGFKNIVHFGSVVTKLENFKYKISLLESYDKKIAEVTSDLEGLPGSASSGSYHFMINKSKWEGKKTELIGTFDDMEEHLYYSSQSYVSNSYGEFIPFSWPKVNTVTPYALASVTSSMFKEWYGQIDNPTGDNYNTGVLYSASRYDEFNDNALEKTIPAHIRFSEENDLYVRYVNMVGDHYDQLYIYIKHLLDIHNRDFPLYDGLPKKLLEPVLRSFGWHPYQSFDFDDLWAYNFGTDGSGSFGGSHNNMSANFSESISYAIDSQKSQSFSRDDIAKELWKRILNNLPYTLKTKGTAESIQSIISAYGLPSTILSIHEYGGPQKKPGKHSKNIYDRFSYALKLNGGDAITGSWAPATSSFGKVRYPDTVEFRFNIPDKIENKKDMILWNTYSGSMAIWAEHSGSYIENQSESLYGRMVLSFRSGSGGASTYMTTSTEWAPFYDNDWWNVMVHRRDPVLKEQIPQFTSSLNLLDHKGQDLRYEMYCKKMSDFSRFGRINWAVSTSIDISGSASDHSASFNEAWGGIGSTALVNAADVSTLKHFFGGATESLAGDDFLYNSGSMGGDNRKLQGFSGSVQEFRLWHQPLSQSSFDYHVHSPLSIAGNHVTASYDDLLLRWSLGANLKKENVNHGYYVSSSQPFSGSRFRGPNSSLLTTKGYFSGFISGPGSEKGYSEEEERYFTLMPRSIGPSPYSEKIRLENNKLLGQLHPIESREYSSADQNPLDSNKLGIFFSPTRIIDLDITNELGPFEFDNYVGDPRDTYRKKYTQLERLRNHYWKKHGGNPDFFMFLKMIRYFDDSLFRTVRQLIPARAKGQVGLLVNPNLLERPRILKYPSASKTGYKVNEQELPKFDQTILDCKISAYNSTSFSGYVAGENGPFKYTGLTKKQSSNNLEGVRAGAFMMVASSSNAGMQKDNFTPKNALEAERGLDNRTVGEIETGIVWDDKYGYFVKEYGSRYIHTTVEFPHKTDSVAEDGAKVWNAYYRRDAWGMTIHTPPHHYIHRNYGYDYDNFTASSATDITDGYVRYGLNRKHTTEIYVPFISESRKSFERYKNLYYFATDFSRSLKKAIPTRHIRNWGNASILGGTGHPFYKGSSIPSGSNPVLPSHSLSESAEYQDFKQTPLQNLYWHGCKLVGSNFNMESAQTIDGGPVVEYYDVSPYKYVAADENADGRLLTAGEGLGESPVLRADQRGVGRRYESPAGQNLRGGTAAPNARPRG